MYETETAEVIRRFHRRTCAVPESSFLLLWVESAFILEPQVRAFHKKYLPHTLRKLNSIPSFYANFKGCLKTCYSCLPGHCQLESVFLHITSTPEEIDPLLLMSLTLRIDGKVSIDLYFKLREGSLTLCAANVASSCPCSRAVSSAGD